MTKAIASSWSWTSSSGIKRSAQSPYCLHERDQLSQSHCAFQADTHTNEFTTRCALTKLGSPRSKCIMRWSLFSYGSVLFLNVRQTPVCWEFYLCHNNGFQCRIVMKPKHYYYDDDDCIDEHRWLILADKILPIKVSNLSQLWHIYIKWRPV